MNPTNEVNFITLIESNRRALQALIAEHYGLHKDQVFVNIDLHGSLQAWDEATAAGFTLGYPAGVDVYWLTTNENDAFYNTGVFWSGDGPPPQLLAISIQSEPE
jgi:hypothetical protein